MHITLNKKLEERHNDLSPIITCVVFLDLLTNKCQYIAHEKSFREDVKMIIYTKNKVNLGERNIHFSIFGIKLLI